MITMAHINPLSPAAIACLHQLFKTGPIWEWDGNVISKAGCDELIKAGYADRVDGFAFLTRKGVKLAVSCHEREKM